ncbi:uncharacterized protein [Diabrotica undecimpunctata]|uniref:uncharacterized protein n=1 Tax=Diabrotica undecimpunctata TaxID=50387 RepID=UPI003B637599
MMLLKWCSCVVLIILLSIADQSQCIFSSRSSSSGSRGSSRSSSSFGSGSRSSSSWGSSGSSFGSSGSRGSTFGSSGSRSNTFGTGSRGLSSFGSFGSHGTSFGSGSRGSSSSFGSSGTYGWKVTAKPVTSRPFTNFKPVTSRFQPVTTRVKPVSSGFHTVAPSHRTYSRQPAFNPNFNAAPSKVTPSPGVRNAITKQPAYNPFFTTSSHLSAPKKPQNNPFFTSSPNQGSSQFGRPTPRPVFHNPHQKNNASGFNNFAPPKSGSVFNTQQNHGSSFNNFGSATSRPRFNSSSGFNNQRPAFSNSGSTFNTQNHGSGLNNFGSASSRPHFNSSNGFSQRPVFQRPLGNGNLGRPVQPWRPGNSSSNWGHNQRPLYTTSKPLYQGRSWNTTSFSGSSLHRPGAQGNVYQPPTSYRNTYTTGSGVHSHYPVQPVLHPIHTQPSTTIINNNNHYYGGSTYYRPGYSSFGTGSTHVTVINNNNYHHHVIVPTRHYYSYGPPAIGVTVVNSYDPFATTHYHTTYHYSTYDTGSTSLGFFLGYQLGKISRPSYYYHSTTYVNNEYVPRYDHYTVHHYYHNSESIPKVAPIQPNAVVVCPGDSSSLCPPGTMSLCTNNGAVMCVVNAMNTSPCSTNKQVNCANSTIPCENNSSPECKQKTAASVSIPCVSTANIPASVDFINNSVIVTDANDSTVKSFCVTVLALPSKNETETSKDQLSQQLLENSVPFQYTTNQTGVDLLGYYLAHKVQNLVQPTFSYLNYDQNYNYVEKFDHYDVFQYYHGADVLPKEVEVKPDQIMSCAGDSGTVCPQYTSSLCLNDGAVICVANKSSTIFSNELQTNYLNGSIPCDKLKSPFCVHNRNTKVPIQIPCFSTAKVYANISLLEKSFGIDNDIQRYKTFELSNVTANSTAQNITELCVTVLLLPAEKTIAQVPKMIKVTGLPNKGNHLDLSKYIYRDLSNNEIGLYLLETLPKLSFPSYYFINAYLYSENGTVQKYDHYSVHYQEHGREIIPADLEFQAFDLRQCEGDSGVICPINTSAICLNDGGVMCLTDMLLTKSCGKNSSTTCVQSNFGCENRNNCRSLKTIDIPCISTATIYGDIMAVNHNIYVNEPNLAKQYTDLQLIPGTNVNNTPVYHKAQQFCVTIVALPEVRKLSEGEKLLAVANNLLGNIMLKLYR